MLVFHQLHATARRLVAAAPWHAPQHSVLQAVHHGRARSPETPRQAMASAADQVQQGCFRNRERVLLLADRQLGLNS
jgi:hypothetical protein